MVQERIGQALVPASSQPARTVEGMGDPFEEALRRFARRSGVTQPELTRAQQRLTSPIPTEEQKPRGPFGRLVDFVLGGTNWGVIHVGTVPWMVNPLKFLTTGLSTVNYYTAAPIAGGLAYKLRADRRKGQAEFEFEKTYADADNLLERWRSLATYNEKRDRLFWGEKFISSLIFDPTTYIGFGWLGSPVKVLGVGGKTTSVTKLGAIGKRLGPAGVVLGPAESAYISALNLPFDKAAKFFRAGLPIIPVKIKETGRVRLLPLFTPTPSQLGERAGRLAQDHASAALAQAAGKPRSQWMPVDVSRAVGRALDSVDKTPDSELDEVSRALKADLVAQPEFNAEGVRAAQKVIIGSESFLPERFIPARLTDLIDEVSLGRQSPDVIAEQVVRMLGGDVALDAHISKAKGWVDNLVSRNFDRAKRETASLNPEAFLRYSFARGRDNARRWSEADFADEVAHRALMGPILQAIGDTQRKVYQKFLRRYLTSPFARLNLMFPGYLIPNIPEDLYFSMTGQGGINYLDAASLGELSSWSGVLPGYLLTDVEEAAVDIASSVKAVAVEPPAAFDHILSQSPAARFAQNLAKEMPDPVQRALAHPVSHNIWSAMKWLNPAEILTLNTKIGKAKRQGFLQNRLYNGGVAAIAVNHPWLEQAINALPPQLARNGAEAQRVITLAAISGDPRLVRSSAGVLSAQKVNTKMAVKHAVEMAARLDLSPSGRELLLDFARRGRFAGHTPKDVLGNILNTEWEAFSQGGEAAAVNLRLLKDAFETAAGTAAITEADADALIRSLSMALHNFSIRQVEIKGAATVRARIARTSAEKQRIHNAANVSLDRAMSEFAAIKQDLFRLAEQVEVKGFQGTYGYVRTLKRLGEHTEWYHNERRAIDERVFGSAARPKSAADLDPSEWASFFAETDELAQTYVERLRVDALASDQDWERLMTARGVARMRVTPKEFKAGDTISLPDVAAIIGVEPERLTQAVIAGSFFSRDAFARFIHDKARLRGFRGLKYLSDDKLGAIYSEILRRSGLEERIHSAFSAREAAIRAAEGDLEAAFRPYWKPADDSAMQAYAAQVGDAMEAAGPDALAKLKADGLNVHQSAVDDLKRAFVNYDDRTGVDEFFSALFPYWTYESRRIPRLLAQSFRTPVLWSTFGPEGRYWDNTDQGYAHASQLPWLDLNFFGGTTMNTPMRRMFQAGYSPTHDPGFRGTIGKVEEYLSWFGFYPGPGQQIVTQAVVPMLTGERGELGEVLPPAVTGGLAALQISRIPGVNESARRMRELIFPDRFHDYTFGRMLAELGGDPSEYDFEEHRLKPGALRTTPEMVQEANLRASQFELIQESTGVVRFRGDAERKLRDEVDVVIREETGLRQDQIDKYRAQGIPISGAVALSPQARERLEALPHSNEFQAAKLPLKSELARERAFLAVDMWKEYETLRDAFRDQQDELDAGLLAGEILPSVWRERKQEMDREVAGILPKLRGRVRDSISGDETLVNPSARYAPVPVTYADFVEQARDLGQEFVRLRHPQEEAIEGYYSIHPQDRNGDGEPEWSEFFNKREDYLKRLPPETKDFVLRRVARNDSPMEAQYRVLQRGVLGDYFRLDDDLAREMGMEDFLLDLRRAASDPEERARLQRRPRYRAYRTRLNRQKEQARRADPVLEYALFAFGFATEFKNRTAAAWWRADGNTPNLARLSALAKRASEEQAQ